MVLTEKEVKRLKRKMRRKPKICAGPELKVLKIIVRKRNGQCKIKLKF